MAVEPVVEYGAYSTRPSALLNSIFMSTVNRAAKTLVAVASTARPERAERWKAADHMRFMVMLMTWLAVWVLRVLMDHFPCSMATSDPYLVDGFSSFGSFDLLSSSPSSSVMLSSSSSSDIVLQESSNGPSPVKALGRALTHERAYMMLRMNGDGSDYASWEAGSYVQEDDDDFDDPSEYEYEGSDADDDEEDAFDVHAHDEAGDDDDNRGVDLDPAAFPSDEAYARALQEAEDREMAARLLALAGINERDTEDVEDHGGNSQDAWEEVDPDELSYEELLALGEVVGTESRGLSADTIASLPSMSYKAQSTQDGSSDTCVICRLDYEDGDTLTVLSCKHSYHSECINNWLHINKVCPVCSAEVSTSDNS